MRNKLKSYSLVLCLFVFLFVIIRGGLHLNPIGAFAAALSATPLILHSVNRWGENRAQAFEVKAIQEASRRTTYAFDCLGVCANRGQEYARHSNGDERKCLKRSQEDYRYGRTEARPVPNHSCRRKRKRHCGRPTIKKIKKAINCDCCDTVLLRRYSRIVMVVDDIGMCRKSVNPKATELVHRVVPRYRYSILGDVAIVNDEDFE